MRGGGRAHLFLHPRSLACRLVALQMPLIGPIARMLPMIFVPRTPEEKVRSYGCAGTG